MQYFCFLNNFSSNSYCSTKQNEQFSCKWNKKYMKWYNLMHTLNKKLVLLNSARAVLRIYTNPHRLVERTLSSVILCGRLRKSCCINVLQWAKFPFQLLVPTPGSHLPVPSFVPMQLCQWPHSTSDRRKNLSQLLSCCWTTVQENKLPEQAVIPQGCPWNCIHAPLIARQWQKQPGRAAEHIHLMAVASCAQHCPTSTLSFTCLVKPRSWRQATVLQSSKTWVPSEGAVGTCGPSQDEACCWCMAQAGAPSTGEQNPRSLWFVFTTPEHRGHLWPSKAIQSSRRTWVKEDGRLFSSWGWCVPQDSVLCFLTIIWENIQIMSETGEFWGILALLFWVQNYWHLAPNWHHSQKQNSWLKGLFFFLPQYSFHLPHSL